MIPQAPAGFSRRTLFWLVLVGAASFLALIVISALAGNSSGDRAGANPYSESAIGYRGLVSFLENLEMPVLVSRDRGIADALDRHALQVLLEPASTVDLAKTVAALAGGGEVLLVLPKWNGQSNLRKPAWVSSVQMLDKRLVTSIVLPAVRDAEIVRPPALHAVSGPYRIAPAVARPQLVKSARLNRIVGTDQGILLGWVEAYGTTVYVLSDPDILNNQGLGKGRNAQLAAAMLEHIRGGGTVVIDATVNGFTRSPSQWRSLFELPLLPVTLLGLCACGLLFWTAGTRFGAPVPLPPRLAPGKRGLIDNTAQLLDFGDHFGVLLERYRASAIRQVATALHAPAGLDPQDLGRWLDRVAGARTIDITHAELVSDRASAGKTVDGRDMLPSARRIHRWKTEMLRGSIPD
jgi:hypothetical protein